MIRVYRAPWSTNCGRVALALAHKQLDCESVLISYRDRGPVEAVSGQGLVPVLDDDGTVVADSVAIIRYLDDAYPEHPLLPAEALRRAELDIWVEWFERVYKLAPNAIEDELTKASPDHGRVARLAAQIDVHLGGFERLLEGRDHLFGERFGLADCVAFPFLDYAAGRDPADNELFHRVLEQYQSLEDHPRMRAWIERVGQHPRAFGP